MYTLSILYNVYIVDIRVCRDTCMCPDTTVVSGHMQQLYTLLYILCPDTTVVSGHMQQLYTLLYIHKQNCLCIVTAELKRTEVR